MSDKNFKIKSGLQVPGVTSASFISTDSSGVISAGTTLPIANGGTGQTSANNALNALLPVQGGGTINYVLQSSGTDTAWAKLYNQTIKNNGTTVTPRGIINIIGGTFTDSSGSDTTTIDLSGYISTSGGSTITSSSSSVNPLIIKGAASQTANLQEWQNSSGTVLASVGSNGAISSNVQGSGTAVLSISQSGSSKLEINQYGQSWNSTNSSFGTYYNTDGGTIPQVSIFPISASTKGLIIRAYPSQTANLQEWQDSSGTVTASMRSDGLFNSYWGYHTYIQPQSGTGSFMYLTSAGISVVGYSNVANTVFTVKGMASQTGDLQQWQNSGGSVLSRVASNGVIKANVGLVAENSLYGNYTALQINSYVASGAGLVIVGASGQTADLTTWYNSAGTVLAYVRNDGLVNTTAGILATGAFIAAGGYLSGTQMASVANSAATIGLIVKGAASQTANLQEWQNSAGTVLASINASGDLAVQNFTVNGTTTTVNSTTLTISDKNIEIAKVASPTDTTADGAGITIKGTTDKTFNWVQSTAAFTSSEPISAPAFKSAGTAVSSNITLVSGYKYFVDTTAARTLTLPASPSLGDEIYIYDASNSALTNNITVLPNGNKVQGSVQNLLIDSNAAAVYLAYTGSTYGWAVN